MAKGSRLPLIMAFATACTAIASIDEGQPLLLEGEPCSGPEDCQSLLCDLVCKPPCGSTLAEVPTAMAELEQSGLAGEPGRSCGVDGCMACPAGSRCNTDAQCISGRCDGTEGSRTCSPYGSLDLQEGCLVCQVDDDCPDSRCLRLDDASLPFGLCETASCPNAVNDPACACPRPPLFPCGDDAECATGECVPDKPAYAGSVTRRCSMTWPPPPIDS